MSLYCSPALFLALDGLDFPATKKRVIDYALQHNAQEAVIVSLDQLEEGVSFAGIEEICVNVAQACSLEIYRAIEGLHFPVSKEKVVAYAKQKGGSRAALDALSHLQSGCEYRDVQDICDNVL